MAVELLSTDIITFMGYLAPFLMMFVLFLLSVFSGNIVKGFIYLFGIVLISTLCIVLSKFIKKPIPDTALYACRMFSFNNLLDFTTPSISTAIMWFSFVYILVPMFSVGQVNAWLTVFLALMSLINMGSKYSAGCTDFLGLFTGTVLGIACGFAYYAIINGITESPSNYFFISETSSDRKVCSRPSQQEFKCKVYKGGELVTG